MNYIDAGAQALLSRKIGSQLGGAVDGPRAKARRNAPLILIPSGAYHLHVTSCLCAKYIRRKFGLMFLLEISGVEREYLWEEKFGITLLLIKSIKDKDKDLYLNCEIINLLRD